MPPSIPPVTVLTIIISTLLLLVLGGSIIYFLFLYQKKRFRHQREMLELKETFHQTLLQSKLDIQEQTLDHVAKELHANVSHLVSLININLSELLPKSPAELREAVFETKAMTKQLMTELKALSASLNTDHIMHIGFPKALEHELNRLAKIKKYQVSLTKSGEEFRLRADHEIILFRLTQEVLNNIISHADATAINVIIDYTDALMQLTIRDNGSGFDVEALYKETAHKESTGLLNMKKRAKLIDAGFAITSAAGSGTTITIDIPKEANKN